MNSILTAVGAIDIFDVIRNFFYNIWIQFYDVMIVDNRWKLITRGLGNTLLIAFFAIILGTVVGAVMALMKLSKNGFLRWITRRIHNNYQRRAAGNSAYDFQLRYLRPYAYEQNSDCNHRFRIELGRLCRRDYQSGYSGR